MQEMDETHVAGHSGSPHPSASNCLPVHSHSLYRHPSVHVADSSSAFWVPADDESLHFWHLYLTLRPHSSHHRRHTLIPSRCHFTESYKSPPTPFRCTLQPTTRFSDEARRRRALPHDGLTSRASRRAPFSWADFLPVPFYHMPLAIALLRRVAHAQSARHCSLRRLESPPTFPAPSI